MSDMASQQSESTPAKPSAPKDKNCPFCGQAFTSSSLGRHLDLYIKEKNPKPSDGIHDVEAIRKLRGGITRRQARGSMGGRKDSTPVGTPRPVSKAGASSQDKEASFAASTPRGGSYPVDATKSRRPFPHCDASGVIIDLSAKGSLEANTSRTSLPPAVSKQAAQKTQLEMKQKLADALDTARAAELALRELLGSWRAAKQHIENQSMPFEFDPLALDFPALTLQCLQPPPTLFSSTQHPTSTSWSVQSPGEREFRALQAFFKEELRAWKVAACAAATAAATAELTCSPSSNIQRDNRENIKRAEKAAESLERQVEEHVQSAYAVWDSLPMQRQQELWILELARGVGRKQKEMEKMKDQQHHLKQENANLKMQIDQLNRLQQPREFKLLSPANIPIERDVISYAYAQGVKDGKSAGFDLKDQHLDVGAIATKSIERWKNVITSTRVTSGGMSAQRSLDQPMQSSKGHESPPGSSSQGVSQDMQEQGQRQKQENQRLVGQQSNTTSKRPSVTTKAGPVSERAAPSTSTTGPPSIEEEVSDQDADAEMEDDDNFAMMNASPAKHSHSTSHQTTSLDAPRTRGLMQEQGSAPDIRFIMQSGAGSPIGRSTIGLTRSVPNMNINMQGSHMESGDMSMMHQVRGDTLYMDNGM